MLAESIFRDTVSNKYLVNVVLSGQPFDNDRNIVYAGLGCIAAILG